MDTAADRQAVSLFLPIVQIYSDALWISGRPRMGGDLVLYQVGRETGDDRGARGRLAGYGIDVADVTTVGDTVYRAAGETYRGLIPRRYQTVHADSFTRLLTVAAERLKAAEADYDGMKNGQPVKPLAAENSDRTK